MDSTDLHFLKIIDSVNIPVPLEIDTDYQVIAEVSIIKEDKGSKQDGTYKYTYKAKFCGEVQLIKGEKVILGKKKSSWSQKWRRLIEGYGMEYDKFMAWLFTKFDELREEYEATQQTGEENHRD